MKIFVTGGTGFIGTHLVEKLKEKGHTVGVLVANLTESEKENTGWQKEIADFSPDACVHLAWEGLPDYSPETSAKNIRYALSLFNFLKIINCKKVLSVGSAFEKTSPNEAFSVAKKIVQLWGNTAIKNFVWARIFYVYGPGQRKTSLIPYLINCAKNGENPEIKNPSAQNDYIHIDDVTEALSLLLEKAEKSGEYEIGWGKMISNQAIVNVIAEEFGLNDWKKDIGSLEKNELAGSAENSGLKAMGWEPKVNIEEGIKKVINSKKD